MSIIDDIFSLNQTVSVVTGGSQGNGLAIVEALAGAGSDVIVLDKNKGPLVLELNARPGLAIQIANGLGMLPRLRELENITSKKSKNKAKYVDLSIEQRVAYVKTHFND